MNKTFIVGLISLLVGGGAGFLVGKTVYKKFYEDLAQEEIDSVKATFAERYKNEQSASDTSENGMTDEEYAEQEEKDETPNPSRNNVTPLTRSSIDGNPYERAKRNYNLYGTKKELDIDDPKTGKFVIIKKDEDDDDDEPRDAAGKTEKEMMDLTRVDRTQPYIIDDDEYTDEFPHHNKVSLYYYHEDEVLCEEGEDIIEDVGRIVGDEAIPLLDEYTTVWVRNEPLCIDYEIIGIKGSYAELVAAVKPVKNLSPRERYEKKQKEREKREE